MITTHIRRNAIAYLALFVALPGTAWAAATIGAKDIKPDAVRAKHIKDGEVKEADLDVGSVGEDALLTGSVQSRHVEDGQIFAGDIANGAVRGEHVLGNSLSGVHFADGSIAAGDIAAENGLTGAQIDESTLDGVALACTPASVAAAGLVKSSATIPVNFTSDASFIEAASSCGPAPEVRRLETGVYRICTPGETPEVMLTTPIHSGAGSGGTDNVASVAQVTDTGCLPVFNGVAHEVRMVDTGAESTPQDGSFRFIAVNL